MSDQDEMFEAATETPVSLGCPQHMPKKLPGGFDGTEPAKKEHKYGLLKNGVQMIRYASGPLLTLIGKRDRGPCERQGGKTGKIIYKITISRESHAEEVAIDGVSKMTLCSTSNHLLEHCALSVMNSIILTRARDRKHKINNKKNRKAKAAAAKEVK